jgi:hypothetical protein
VFSRTVMFSGGKAARPDKGFRGTGDFRTAAQALYSLQGYTFGMLGMMRRYAEIAFNQKNYDGISNEQRQRARKSLTTMVMTQFAGAGMIGMPFMGAIMQMFEELTGVEAEREIREGLAGLMKEDAEAGGVLTDIVMHGAANAIAGKILPGAPDVGSRFAIGGIMGVNSYDGWSLSALAGPTGSIVEAAYRGVSSIAKDRSIGQGLQEVAPPSWKKQIEMFRNDNEFQDRGGGLLVDATVGEKLAYRVGFTPQRVRQMKNYDRLQRKHEEITRGKDIALHDKLSEIYQQDPRAAQEELRKMAQESPKVLALLQAGDREGAEQEFQRAMRASANKIAERVEKKTFARDPRREGTFAGTSGSDALLSAMGQGGQTTEYQRLLARNQVIANLGLAPSATPDIMQRAQMIDYIMQQNPSIPRPKAALLADRMLSQRKALQRS